MYTRHILPIDGTHIPIMCPESPSNRNYGRTYRGS